LIVDGVCVEWTEKGPGEFDIPAVSVVWSRARERVLSAFKFCSTRSVMVPEKLSDHLGKVLRASSDQDVVKLHVMVQQHLDAQQLREVVRSLLAVDDVTSIDLLPRSKMVLLPTRKRSVPAISEMPGVMHIDLAKEAPLESIVDF